MHFITSDFQFVFVNFIYHTMTLLRMCKFYLTKLFLFTII